MLMIFISDASAVNSFVAHVLKTMLTPPTSNRDTAPWRHMVQSHSLHLKSEQRHMPAQRGRYYWSWKNLPAVDITSSLHHEYGLST